MARLRFITSRASPAVGVPDFDDDGAPGPFGVALSRCIGVPDSTRVEWPLEAFFGATFPRGIGFPDSAREVLPLELDFDVEVLFLTDTESGV